jgi:hypothetical protein
LVSTVASRTKRTKQAEHAVKRAESLLLVRNLSNSEELLRNKFSHSAGLMRAKKEGEVECFFMNYTCQSIGFIPSFSSIAFVLLKCLQPKNPLSADKPEGCTLYDRKWKE